jgi:glycosyltransferase involved in cell wall biosynthesis
MTNTTNMDKPGNTITVVTVVLNDIDHIEATITSVLSQVDCILEYVVVDGGSTDGTLDVIRKYSDRIQHWESARDQGIYYAMNKGIGAATGDWMIFINSGDAFSHSTVVRDMLNQISPHDDIIYGQYLVKYRGGATRKVLPRHIADMWKGTITSHQAMLIRTGLMKAHRFDCDFRLAADYELVSKLYHSGCCFHYVPEVIAVVSAAGVSDTSRADVYYEFSRIARNYYRSKPFRIYFLLKCVESFFRMLAKKVMPAHIIARLQTRNRTKV